MRVISGAFTGAAYDHDGRIFSDGVNKYVYANGELLATYDNLGLHFAFNDWLGTKRVQASPAGAVELNCWNLPFNDGCTLAC